MRCLNNVCATPRKYQWYFLLEIRLLHYVDQGYSFVYDESGSSGVASDKLPYHTLAPLWNTSNTHDFTFCGGHFHHTTLRLGYPAEKGYQPAKYILIYTKIGRKRSMTYFCGLSLSSSFSKNSDNEEAKRELKHCHRRFL